MSAMPPPMLPLDHPHAERILRDHNTNRDNARPSPRKPVTIYEDGGKRPGMHKKTKSSVSLKSLMGSDKGKAPKPPAPEPENGIQLKRPKSSTGLSALLSRSRSPKKPAESCNSPVKDKENRTPPHTAEITPPPIWAQFASQQSQKPRTTINVPLNDNIDVGRDAALYSPQEYSPSKQRNFHDYRPTLAQKTDKKPRPRSESRGGDSGVPETRLGGLGRSFGRESALVLNESAMWAGTTRACEKSDSRGREGPRISEEVGTLSTGSSNDVASAALTKQKRGSRVMAAVAALNGPARDSPNTAATDPGVQVLDVKAIDEEFETLLVSIFARGLLRRS